MKHLLDYKLLKKNAFAALYSLALCFTFQSCDSNQADSTKFTPDSSISKRPGPVINNAADAYITPATEDIVMYEINIGAFSSTHNLQGIINRLDNIKALGINTIWLMPIYPVGIINSIGSPYCVRDYTSVNPNIGTFTDLRQLVTQAHYRHISVILDWVGNHTSWDNSWMIHHEWYTQNASGQIISPAGTTWNDVADLNYNNPEMRIAMIAAMRYWIDTAGVDGFRCDAADYIPFDFWQQAISSLQTGRSKQLIMLAEGSRNDHFTAGFKIDWAWDYQTALKNVFGSVYSPSALFTVNTNEYLLVPLGSRKLRFTTNHDESNTALPLTVYNSKNGALSASAITVFLQGVPLIYSGQEVGVASNSVYQGGTINWTANADMLAAYQNMLGFYNSFAAARRGTVANFSDANIAAFTKTLDNEQVLILANTRGSLRGYTVPAALAGTYLNVITNTSMTLTTTTSIGFSAYRYFILKRIG